MVQQGAGGSSEAAEKLRRDRERKSSKAEQVIEPIATELPTNTNIPVEVADAKLPLGLGIVQKLLEHGQGHPGRPGRHRSWRC